MPGIQWSEEIAVTNFKLFKENADARRGWERDALRFDDFRYGQHFSVAEEKELLAFRQAPLPISVTTAICDTAEALMTASNPTIKVAPIINPYNEQLSELSRKVAQKYNFLIQKTWYDALGGLQYDRVVRDSSNVGHGFFYITPRYEFGEFNVDMKHMGWRYVYPHADTKDPLYRGMDNCVIAMRVSELAGYKIAKGCDSELTEERYQEEFTKGRVSTLAATFSENYAKYSPFSIRREGVLFINRMVLEEQKAYAIVPSKGDPSSQSVRFVTELTDDLKKQIKDGDITYRETEKFFLTEYTSIGSRGYKKVYPITQYNIVPIVYDHRDTPYPLGRVWYLYPLQRALNKFMMIAILNGSLMNSLRIMAEENSIVDENDFLRNFAKPGALLKYRLPIPGQSQPPTIIEGKPLGEAWLQMPRYITYLMEYISGIFGTMMGDSKESPDIFSTVASLQSAGGQKIKKRLGNADAALSVVGNVVGEFYREYAPLNGFASIIDENGEEKEPELYNVVRVKKGTTNELEIQPDTDLSRGFKSVRFTSQASNGFESGTEAALLTNLATQLKRPELVPLILKRLNIPDVDKIMESMDMVAQQNATIEEMSKAIGDLEKRTGVLASQVTQKSFEVSKAQFDAWFAGMKGEIKNMIGEK